VANRSERWTQPQGNTPRESGTRGASMNGLDAYRKQCDSESSENMNAAGRDGPVILIDPFFLPG
jgi:hypothetical protein